MGGKGQRRREKNYRAAHGGYSRLPPPPKPNEVDVLPSKLRKIIDFTTTSTSTTATTTDKGNLPNDTDNKNKNKKRDNNKVKPSPKDESSSKIHTPVVKDTHKGGNVENVHEENSSKKKGKRKRKQVEDLRFATTDDLGSYGSKKKEKRKKRSEAKKNKHKKAKTLDGTEFPGHEDIKFGDVVDAPPKLPAATKGLKKIQDASHERLRLQAVEAYRNRKGWGSRPGILLPHISNPMV